MLKPIEAKQEHLVALKEKRVKMVKILSELKNRKKEIEEDIQFVKNKIARLAEVTERLEEKKLEVK